MTETCILPPFTDQQAAQAASDLFDLNGSIKKLNGERDLNFVIRCEQNQFAFKIANHLENLSMLECQHAVFQSIEASRILIDCPQSIRSVNDNIVESINCESGFSYYCRVVTFIEGPLLSDIFPRSSGLLESIGKSAANIDLALQGFKHEAIERPLLWNMADAMDIVDRFKPLISNSIKYKRIERYQSRFRERVLSKTDELRFGAIHNDINDNNVVVQNTDPWNHSVKAIIDFGDMVYSWLVVDPAVAAAYMMLDSQKPLDVAASVVKGYHQNLPLSEAEIGVFYELICTRLCLSVCVCAYQQSLDPGNEYLRISEQPAWQLLERLEAINPDFAHYVIRDACGLDPVPNSKKVSSWLGENKGSFAYIIDYDLNSAPLLIMDNSVGSPELPNPATIFDPVVTTRQILRAIEDANCIAAIGRYDEYRLLYSSDDFNDSSGHRRTLHLGIDIFMTVGTAIYAPLDGTVYGVADNDAYLDYGGTLILEHIVGSEAESLKFYSLYGHLRPESLNHYQPGDSVHSGQKLGEMGDVHENGNWSPHVHFEIITDMLGETTTFVGVGTDAHRNVWLNLCPDPNLILGIPETVMPVKENNPSVISEQIFESRMDSLGPSLSLSYRQPIHMVRGEMQYLYDYTGRKYLDAVNNVPHVGHCHPSVVEAQRRQSEILNTNTRYLYSTIQAYSERLLAKFSDMLNVCFFVNSGSEANDLGLRLARNFTARQDVAILDHAYHGNLTSLIEISPYKHNSAGGMGPPVHVHTAQMPNMYRDKYSDHDTAVTDYIQSLKQALQQAESQSGPAAFICESILGCGGPVVLPDGYLDAAYQLVRKQGGLCIADEVQVGFGRVGSHFWAFETQGVVPDIVTLGKPMGNGHPLAAVVTTREIADAFNNGMEYFSTYGGNPVSCAIGNAVLDVIENEDLQENALIVGNQLFEKLIQLKERYPLIGDVRGKGLFVGIELVNNHRSLVPADTQANYIAERMKEEGILISTDGPLHNVLKIKPPLCFNSENVDHLISSLDSILQEWNSQPLDE